jgi:hypothetical protein
MGVSFNNGTSKVFQLFYRLSIKCGDLTQPWYLVFFCLENLVINVILADRKLRCSNQRINMLKIVKEDVHR